MATLVSEVGRRGAVVLTPTLILTVSVVCSQVLLLGPGLPLCWAGQASYKLAPSHSYHSPPLPPSDMVQGELQGVNS